LPKQIGVVYWFYRRWQSHPSLAEGQEVETMANMFAGGVIPLSLMALVVELILLLLGVIVILGLTPKDFQDLQVLMEAEETGKPPTSPVHPSKAVQDIVNGVITPGLVVFGLFMSYIVAALTEEFFKWVIVRVQCNCGLADFACCQQRQPLLPRTTILLFLSAACGFSVIETVFYIRGNPGFWQAILVAAGRVFLALPTHLICAGYTAVRLAQQELPIAGVMPPPRSCAVARALVPAVLIHGTYDFIALAGPFLFAGAGVVGGTALTIALCLVVEGVALYYLRQEVTRTLEAADAAAGTAAPLTPTIASAVAPVASTPPPMELSGGVQPSEIEMTEVGRHTESSSLLEAESRV
jgi:RsiW-degrading membrane proteinase PrsW (M82 family)